MSLSGHVSFLFLCVAGGGGTVLREKQLFGSVREGKLAIGLLRINGRFPCLIEMASFVIVPEGRLLSLVRVSRPAERDPV